VRASSGGRSVVSLADCPKEVEVPKKTRRILTLVLTTLAGWLAAKLTDMILGPAKKAEEGRAE
jgi:hypothetical protein